MSKLLDAFLPWKAIPAMVKDVKSASKTKTADGKKNYDSIFGAIGKHSNPFDALLGEKGRNFLHGTIPREANRAMQPMMDFHREKLDPIWRFGGKKAVGGANGDFANVTSTKGADITAAVLAMIAGAGALGGGAAGGAGGGGGAGGSGASAGSVWSNPQTYMNMGFPSGGGGQQPQQQPFYPLGLLGQQRQQPAPGLVQTNAGMMNPQQYAMLQQLWASRNRRV